MLDIIIAVVLTLFAYSGYRRGLLRSVYGFISFVLSGFIAIRIQPYVAEWLLKNTQIHAYFSKKISEVLIKNVNADSIGNISSIKGIENILPDNFTEGLLKNIIPNLIDVLNINEKFNYVCDFLADSAVRAFAAVVSFAVTAILIESIRWALRYSFRRRGIFPFGRIIKKAIRVIDRAAGSVIGFIKGAILVWFIVTIMFVVAPSNQKLFELTQNSYFAKLIQNNNPLISFFTDFEIPVYNSEK
jgi:uncharacterized membrane protein required for colicin V production